jgi:hypothetical protein
VGGLLVSNGTVGLLLFEIHVLFHFDDRVLELESEILPIRINSLGIGSIDVARQGGCLNDEDGFRIFVTHHQRCSITFQVDWKKLQNQWKVGIAVWVTVILVPVSVGGGGAGTASASSLDAVAGAIILNGASLLSRDGTRR